MATESVSVQVFQFVGLMWATEYNADRATAATCAPLETVYSMNAVLSAFAALEALASETAAASAPNLYAERSFQRAGLMTKCERLLAAIGRAGEAVPATVAEISARRVALTHSEPDSARSALLGQVINARAVTSFATAVRSIAEWLWAGSRPIGVATDFDAPNPWLRPDAAR